MERAAAVAPSSLPDAQEMLDPFADMAEAAPLPPRVLQRETVEKLSP